MSVWGRGPPSADGPARLRDGGRLPDGGGRLADVFIWKTAPARLADGGHLETGRGRLETGGVRETGRGRLLDGVHRRDVLWAVAQTGFSFLF